MAAPGSLPQLTQGQHQQQLLLPRMLQAIEVLQLPSMELGTWLREAFEGNAALVVEEPAAPPEQADRGPRARARAGASDRHAEWLAAQEAGAEHWRASILEQLDWLDLDPATDAWARWLVDRLDADGLLTDDDDELLAGGACDGLEDGPNRLGAAIAALQRLEPRGLGGRDATEALLLQLEPADPDYPRLCVLIERFLDDVCRNKLPAVARKLALDVPEVARLVARLGGLRPRPIDQLEGEAAPAVAPDVVVLADGDEFRLEFPRTHLPSVTLDPDFATLAADRTLDAETRAWARGRVGEARAVIDALEQRQATLERVARAVFTHQRAYLEHGPSRLAPLAMVAVAEELELHVSTISRAVAGKYAQTPWGIEPLRRFFQAAAGGGRAGASSAADEVRERVRALFAGEDHARPLSDDEAVARLAAGGVELARRTVAKYRQELGIPSSYRRRRFV